jgi:hypothetical protein
MEELCMRWETEQENTRLVTRYDEAKKYQYETDRLNTKISQLELDLKDRDETVNVLTANLKSFHLQSQSRLSDKAKRRSNADLENSCDRIPEKFQETRFTE